jgi:hypothetical protein
VRSGGKEKAFYVLIFIELVTSYGRKKMSFVWSLVKKLKKMIVNLMVNFKKKIMNSRISTEFWWLRNP